MRALVANPPGQAPTRVLLLRRIRWVAAIQIGGLAFGGGTAIPIEPELCRVGKALE